MRFNRALRVLTTTAIATTLLTGCSLFGGSDDPGSSGPNQAVELADDGSVKDSLATMTRRYGDYDVTIDVLRLARYDKVVRAEFAITPRSHGSTSRLSTYVLGSGDVSDVYLLDEMNMRKYPVLSTSDDKCVCSSGLSDFSLDQPTLLFADFPVAPENVTSLVLVAPELGPLPSAKLS